MEKDEEITRVIFRTERSGEFKGEVTAVFPDLPGSPGYMLCYAHFGQHGDAGLAWYYRTRPATEAEYSDLKAELENMGYNLKVCKKR